MLLLESHSHHSTLPSLSYVQVEVISFEENYAKQLREVLYNHTVKVKGTTKQSGGYLVFTVHVTIYHDIHKQFKHVIHMRVD